jgi:hypothetical protein
MVQTSYSLTRTRAVAGMVADSFQHEYLSRVLATQQIEELTFGTADGTYTVTVNGVVVGTFVASSNTAAQIRDNIYDDIVASAAPVTATKVSTNKLQLKKNDFAETGFTIAISTVSGYSKSQLVAQGAVVPFGVGLCRDDDSPVSGYRCRLPRVAADVTAGFLGIAGFDSSEQYALGGWQPGSLPKLLHRGHIWCVTEGAIAELAQMYCRYASGAGGSQLGAFRGDADTSSAAPVVGLRALESCSGAGIVLAEYIPNT